MKNQKRLLGFIMILLCASVFAQDAPKPPKTDQERGGMDNLDPKAWGIDKGCITTSRIKSFRYFEAGAARIELTGGKVVVMRFTNRCYGLRNNGIIYETRTGKLCAGFDSVRVIRQGSICPIESIEPLVEPEMVEVAEESIDGKKERADDRKSP